MIRDRLAPIALALLLGSCGSSLPSPAIPTTTHTPAATAKATPAPTRSPCDVGAQTPPQGAIPANYATALAFAPDGRLFWAERGGSVMVWQNNGAHLFATVSTVTSEPGGGYSERGLLGIAISPTFAQDHFVFAFYSDSNFSTQHVVRWTDCAGTAGNAAVIITLPAGGDCCHKGGRLAAGTDGKLYVTLGEEHDAPAAQNTGDVRGKILRYNLDGTSPADNPFGAQNPVWAYGFRNPFGIAFSATGQLGVTNNGPSGDAGSPRTGYDDAYLNVTRGGGYQWPRCYGYSHPLQASDCGGQVPPDWSSEASTYVPTGATFVSASGPSGYAGAFVFCSFDRGMVVLTAATPHATAVPGPGECKLDVKQGPDRALYYSDIGHIYRLA
jgi:glucose/arabinose dehydrogenase